MFDDYNLIIKINGYSDLKFEVRDYQNEGFHSKIVRYNKDIWFGAAIEKGQQIEIIKKATGEIVIGQLFIPTSMLSIQETKRLLKEFTDNDSYQKYLTMLHIVFNVSVCIMMMGLERQRTQIKRHEHKNKKNETSAQSTNHRKNKVFLLDDIVEYISDNYIESKEHHEIQCPCWEVRGHYRHYKNGNVVFVSAYKKGKNRLSAEPKPKEYYI